MYLVCPRCISIFDVEEKALGAEGRQVSCSVCSEAWQALPENLKSREQLQTLLDASPAPPLAPAPPPAPAHAPPSPPPPPLPPPSAPAPSPAASMAPETVPPPLLPKEDEELPTLRHVSDANVLVFMAKFLFSWGIWMLFVLALFYGFDRYSSEIITRFPRTLVLYDRLQMVPPEIKALRLNWEDYALSKARISNEFRNAQDKLLVEISVTNLAASARPAPILRGAFQSPAGEETAYFHFVPQQLSIPVKGALLYSLTVPFPKRNASQLILSLTSAFEAQIDLGGRRLPTRTTR